MTQIRRVPRSCPAGFLGRYRVVAGDTMFAIASFFRRPLSELIRVNPHISNPNELFPGDVLCVPGEVPFPCGVVLTPGVQVPPTGTEGVALVHIDSQGTQAVTVAATLPPPESWGDFDLYLAEVIVSEEVGGFGNQLFPTPLEARTWAVTISLPTVVSLTPGSAVRILPSNSETGVSGQTILLGGLNACLRANNCAADIASGVKRTRARRDGWRHRSRRRR